MTALNPKAALVYLVLAPGFLDPAVTGPGVATQIAALTAAHMVLVTAWLLLWTVFLAHAERLLASPGRRAAISRFSGVLLVLLGLRLLLS